MEFLEECQTIPSLDTLVDETFLLNFQIKQLFHSTKAILMSTNNEFLLPVFSAPRGIITSANFLV